MTLFFTAVTVGLGIGAIYGLVGIGYTVIFSATRTFNLAQGDLVMVGVMMSWFMMTLNHVPQILTLLTVVTLVALISWIEERLVVRPFLKRGSSAFGWFIATLGFSVVIETVVNNLFGNHAISAIPSPFPSTGFKVGSVVISYQNSFVFVVFIIVILALELFQRKTWIGQAMRASSEDREAVSLLGINPSVMSQVAFVIAGAVAGLTGWAIAPIVFSDPSIGLNYTVKGFLALAIGGFGSVRGAVVGGLLLGIAEQLFDVYSNSDYEIVVGLVIVLAVLILRPEGLFRSTAARAV